MALVVADMKLILSYMFIRVGGAEGEGGVDECEAQLVFQRLWQNVYTKSFHWILDFFYYLKTCSRIESNHIVVE